MKFLRWPNTVFTHSLANAIQRAQGLQKKQTWFQYSNHFICSMFPLPELFFFITEQIVLMVLVFYEKCMLEKVTMEITLHFTDFSLLLKEPS